MKLIGYMDSPFVRRVAITAKCLGIDVEHEQISVLREYDRFSEINPLVKAPTLICDDGQLLVDSNLIIDYLVSRDGGGSLMPSDESGYVRALWLTGVSLVAMEKTVQLIYEIEQRPESARHEPWAERCRGQLAVALGLLEEAVGSLADEQWLCGSELTQADISTAVATRFTSIMFPDEIRSDRYPGLAAFSARAEAQPAFEACPI